MMYGVASIGGAKLSGLPMVVGTTIYRTEIDSVTHTFSTPSGEVGDLLVVFFAINYDQTLPAQIPGWSLCVEAVGEGTWIRNAVQLRTAPTTESETFTVTMGDGEINGYNLERAKILVYRLRNVDSYIQGFVGFSNYSGQLRTVTAPTGKGWYLYIGVNSSGFGGVWSDPPANGYTDLLSYPLIGDEHMAISSFRKLTTANSCPDLSFGISGTIINSRRFHFCFYKN